MSISPSPNLSTLDIEDIDHKVDKIIKNIEKYKENTKILYQTIDENGNPINLQTLSDKISIIKSNLTELSKKNIKQTSILNPKIQNLRDEIKSETETLNYLVTEAMNQIKSGNSQLKDSLLYLFAEMENNLSSQQIQSYSKRLNTDAKKLKKINQFVDEFDEAKQEESEFIPSSEGKELENTMQEIRNNANKIQFRKIIGFNPDSSQSSEEQVSRLTESFSESAQKLEEMKRKIEELEIKNNINRNSAQILTDIKKLKVKMTEFRDKLMNNVQKSKINKDFMNQFKNIEETISELSFRIQNDCNNATSENVDKYFADLNKMMNDWRISLDKINSQFSQVIPSSVISRSFVDVESHEKDIQTIINNAENNHNKAKSSNPLNEYNIKPILKNIEEIKNKTNELPPLARSVLKVSDGIGSIRDEISVLNTMTAEIERRIENIYKIKQEIQNDENAASKYHDRIESLKDSINNLQNTSEVSSNQKQIKSFVKDVDVILTQLSENVKNCQNKDFDLSKHQNSVEDCINKTISETNEARKKINDSINKEFEKYKKDVDKNIDSIAVVGDQTDYHQQISDFKSRSVNELDSIISDYATIDELANLKLSLKTMKENFDAKIQKLNSSTKKVQKDSTLDQRLKEDADNLLNVEKTFALVTSSILHPFNNTNNKIIDLSQKLRLNKASPIASNDQLVVFDLRHRPNLEIVPSRADNVFNTYNDVKKRIDKMNNLIQTVDNDIQTVSKVDRMMRIMNTDNLDNMKLKLPKGAESIPETNWEVTRMMDRLGIL